MFKTKKYTALEIAKIVGGRLFGKNIEIENVFTDTREEKIFNACFFALKGENFDGTNYIDEAISRGATLVVAEEEVNVEAPVIYVNDTREAFLRLSANNIGKTKIIAITGSSGKTTVKEMVKSVLAQEYKVCATSANDNNEIGVAKTLFSISDHDFCILEMGMRSRGEIGLLASIVKPYISVITNIGLAHLGRLGSEDEIFNAKCELLPFTSKYAIVPCEERFRKANFARAEPIFVGNDGKIKVDNVNYVDNKIRFNIVDQIFDSSNEFEIQSPFFHDCKNFLIAYLIGRLLNVSVQKIQAEIFEFKNFKNRGNVFEIKGITIIDDCYNCSYNGLKSSIAGLISYAKANNKIPCAVLGDMLEIGIDSYKYHREIGEFARKSGVKKLFCKGEFSCAYCEGFEGGKRCSTTSELVESIVNSLNGDEIILVKASRGERFELVIDEMKERLNGA